MGPVSISPLRQGHGIGPSKRKIQIFKAAWGPWKMKSFFVWGWDEKLGGLLSGLLDEGRIWLAVVSH